MPRVKNVDCKSCNSRVNYEYAIHRQTFTHKLHSAKYAANGSMIYYDSIDLDKTGEHINVQSLKQHNKEADNISKAIKKEKKMIQKQQQKKTEKLHDDFQRKRKLAAQSNKHLLPKSKLNILQRKLAWEAELIYQKQMASVKTVQMFPTDQNYDDDLQHFKLNPKTTKPKCLPALHTSQHSVLPSNTIFSNFNLANSIKPLANSTQICYTQSSNTSQLTDTSFNNAVVEHIIDSLSPEHTNAHSNLQHNINTVNNLSFSSTAQSTQHNIPVSVLQSQSLNISKIPMPTTTMPTQPSINNHIQNIQTADICIYNNQEKENISFNTSFYTQPTISAVAMQHINNNHIHHYSSPQSPINHLPQIKPIQTTFRLRRLAHYYKVDNNTNPICRKCGVNIDFKMLLNIPTHMPTGRQIMCAPCLLMISSISKDRNVDYFNRFQ